MSYHYDSNSAEYRNELLNCKISYNEIIEHIKMPTFLYKYQNFYHSNTQENKYWKDNINGAFHLSLGSEFEDINDCKPFINRDDICKSIQEILNKNNCLEDQIKIITSHVENIISEEYINNVISNYQNEISIGCFTTSSDNKDMWNKYGNNSTGFCIQYSVKHNKLLQYSTLPVVYDDVPYNSSIALACSALVEMNRLIQKRSLEENIKIKEKDYEIIRKTMYIPIFIKQLKWSFENEFRMFLLQHRNTKVGMICADEELDEHRNINLKNAISAIYLGENFELNPNSQFIKNSVIDIAKQMNVKVFQKRNLKDKYTNVPLL